MTNRFNLNTDRSFLYYFLILFPIIIFANLIPLFIFIILYIISTLILGRNFIIFLIIVSYLTLVGDVVADYRVYIHIANLLMLLYFFFKDNGLKFSHYPVFPMPLYLFIIMLFLVMLFSTLLSDYFFSGILHIIKSIYFLVLIYLFFSLIKKEDDIWLIIKSLLISSLILSFGAIYDLSKINFDLLTFSVDAQFRSGGLFGNVNAVAGFFAVSIPLGISLFFLELRIWNKNIIISLVFLLIIGLIITVSRSGFLSVIISSFIILFYFKRKVFWRLFFSSFASLFILFLIDDIREIIFSLLRFDAGLSQRDHYWNLTLDMFKDNPIFGVGPGAWGKEMFNYFPVMMDTFEGQLLQYGFLLTEGANAAHNIYLVFLSEMGILGLIVISVFVFVFYFMIWKIVRQTNNLCRDKYILTIGIAAIGAGMFIRGFFDSINLFSFGWISIDLPFWFMILIISYIYNSNFSNLKDVKLNIVLN